MQRFNIVKAPIILLFSKKWVPGLTAEDNIMKAIQKWSVSQGVHEVIGYNTQGIVRASLCNLRASWLYYIITA